MQAAVITASVSVVVAVLVFVLNQLSQLRQVQLTRINDQLRELYGPLHALVDVNERIWNAMPRKKGDESWHRWRDRALMPTNLRMRELIIQHADLLIEQEFPKPVQDFCAHVSSYEVFLTDEEAGPVLIGHPGDAYVEYVRTSFARLKAEQRRLLRLAKPVNS